MDEANGARTRAKVGAKRLVLAAVDYSDASGLALSSAADLARADPMTELHVVHVIDLPYPMEHDRVEASDLPRALEKAGEDVKLELPKFYAETIRGLESRVVGHVSFGRPDREIVLLAGDLGADLIVLGTHGRSRVERVFLGSVAERVLRAAPCAVLVVRAKEEPHESLLGQTRTQASEPSSDPRGPEMMTFRFSDR